MWLSTKIFLAAPLACHTEGKIYLMSDQRQIHIHKHKAVLVTDQPDPLDDDRDCCCVQPVAVAQVVAYSYRLHAGTLAQVAAGNYHQQMREPPPVVADRSMLQAAASWIETIALLDSANPGRKCVTDPE